MSKVISFRLDADNFREARAYLFLLRKQKEGYSTREIITQALIGREENDTNSISCLEHQNLIEIIRQLDQLSALLPRSAGSAELGEVSERHPNLSTSLITSVKHIVKPGLLLE